jgi:DNA gyrase subunit A
MKTGDKTGGVIGALTVSETDELMLITNKGQMIRTRVVEVRATSRNTMGVKLIDLNRGEKLKAIAPVVSDAEEEEVEVEGEAAGEGGAPAEN